MEVEGHDQSTEGGGTGLSASRGGCHLSSPVSSSGLVPVTGSLHFSTLLKLSLALRLVPADEIQSVLLPGQSVSCRPALLPSLALVREPFASRGGDGVTGGMLTALQQNRTAENNRFLMLMKSVGRECERGEETMTC